MKVDRDLLAKLEKLSHLYVNDAKKDQVVSQLSDILGYVQNLGELDTTGLDSYFSTLNGGTPMRKDEPVNNNEVGKSILANAPYSEDDFFVVPAIIE